MPVMLHPSRIIIRSVTYPPVKNLTRYFVPQAGHNNTGKVTFISKTRRVRRRYRLIDFKRLYWNVYFLILRVEYDPNRSAFIALICFLNGMMTYIIASDGLKTHRRFFLGEPPRLLRDRLRVGFILPISYCNEGSFLNTVELNIDRGGTLARSAGTAITLLKKLFTTHYLIKLPSKEQILIDRDAVGNLGRVSNPDRKFTYFRNAGQRRRLGWKPKVRGVARNPIDHPHGGGGGKCLVTPWARIAKTRRTRDPLKVSSQIVRSRRLAIRKIVIVKLKKMGR
jgi:large subunit ribosomal protein L2